MPVIAWIPVGRFAVSPDDSLHLGQYGYAVKSLVLDGDSVAHIDQLSLPYGPALAGYIDVAKSTPTYAAILVDSTGADSADGVLFLRVAADSTPPGVQMRLLAVITEDSLVTEGFLGTTWNRVARRVVPNYQGKELNVARGDTLYDTLRFSTVGLNPAKLKAALFIQNAADWTIIQALSVNRLTP